MRTHLLPLLTLCCLGLGAAETPKDPNAGVVTDPAAVEVWTTDNGTKYHTKECANSKIKETLAEAIVDGDTPCAKCSPPVYDPTKIVVFASESGKKYHLFSCRYAKTQLTLKAALDQGYEACGTCKPMGLWTPPKAADAAAKPADPAAKPAEAPKAAAPAAGGK